MSNNRIKGIDVSFWNGHINWRRVKNEYDCEFVLVKATQGDDTRDDKFYYNWSGTRRFGMIRGAYHFMEPKIDPIAQADYYLDVVGDILHSTDFPPIVDVEIYPPSIAEKWASQTEDVNVKRLDSCLNRLRIRTGRDPIIYTSQSAWKAITGGSDSFVEYPLWVANHFQSSPNLPANNWGGRGWLIWQYTRKGKVPGINSEVDLDWFYNGQSGLHDFLGVTGRRPSPPYLANGTMVQAFEEAAKLVDEDVDQLLNSAGIAYIKRSSNLNKPYDGPALEEMDLPAKVLEALNKSVKKLEARVPAGIPIGFTNQDMIDALYSAADKLLIGGWVLIVKAGLTSLANDRHALYQGPSVDKMGLDANALAALKAVLGVDPSTEPESPVPPPYPSISNQDVINAFYEVAAPLGEDYWEWIRHCGLEAIATIRSAIYRGPMISDLPLADSNKDRLMKALNVEDIVERGKLSPFALITNQVILNTFREAALGMGEDHWKWIELAGLRYIAEPTENRFNFYAGPEFVNLPNLSEAQISTLEEQFAKR